jgi:hypothetical protein
MAINEINEVVPIELAGLRCSCGGTDFTFAIRSLKPDRLQNPSEWKFDLDIICSKCRRKKLTEKIASFFRLKRIKVGPAGVDLVMK